MDGCSLPKAERLCGKKAVGALLDGGKGGVCGSLRYRYLQRGDDAAPRMMVSVPKRAFKRAVKRNLLKRRIRESYRRQKGLLPAGVDILFIYASQELLPYADIYADMTAVLSRFSHE